MFLINIALSTLKPEDAMDVEEEEEKPQMSNLKFRDHGIEEFVLEKEHGDAPQRLAHIASQEVVTLRDARDGKPWTMVKINTGAQRFRWFSQPQ